MKFYVYAYLRDDETPYYIGKGSGRRAYSTVRAIKRPKDDNRIVILQEGLTEQEAFDLESWLIGGLGRKDLGTGILRNRSAGGEGAAGAKWSEESRKKLAKTNTGKKHSEESKRKMAAKAVGRKDTEETRRKKSVASKARPLPKEFLECMEGEFWTGRQHSEATKRKISETKKRKFLQKLNSSVQSFPIQTGVQ